MKHTVVFVILLQICVQVHHSQKITLDAYNHSKSLTSCADGLVVNDTFFFTGQFDATGTYSSALPTNINFLVGRFGDISNTLCVLGTTYICSSSLGDRSPCYCYSKFGDVFNFIINVTASLSMSNKTIQAKWFSSDFKDTRVTEIRQVPIIYDTVTYTVNGTQVTSLEVNYKQNNIIECCILNLAVPYLIDVEWDRSIISSVTNTCATAVIHPNDVNTHNLILRYSENGGCKRTGSFTIRVNVQHSQKITLDAYNHSQSTTNCVDGLLVNDKFIFTGQMDATGTSSSEWPFNIIFLYGSSYNSIKLCDLDIEIYGCSSSLGDRLPCYCYSKFGDVFNFIINVTAALSMSNNTIQGKWIRLDFTDARATEIRQFPTIYDTVKYTVNGTQVTSLEVNYKQNNIIECCILNLAVPYLIDVEWDRSTISSVTNTCATAVIHPKDENTHNLILSYSENGGCKRTGRFTIRVNVKQSSPDSSTTIIVVVVVAVIGLTIGIVVGIFFYKKVIPVVCISRH